MENLSMCRICLASDIRLCSLTQNLQEMYEKLTELTFQREDRQPQVVCYICHARLQNCHRLRKSCLQGEELLTEILTSSELTPQEVSTTNTFRVESVVDVSLGPVIKDNTDLHIKKEPPDVTDETPKQQENNEDNNNKLQEALDTQIVDDVPLSHLVDHLYAINRNLEENEIDIKMEPQEEHDTQTDDNIQCSHLEVSGGLDVMKREPDDVETGPEDIDIEVPGISNYTTNTPGPSSLTYNIGSTLVRFVPVSDVPAMKNFSQSNSILMTKPTSGNKNIVIGKLTPISSTNVETLNKPKTNKVLYKIPINSKIGIPSLTQNRIPVQYNIPLSYKVPIPYYNDPMQNKIPNKVRKKNKSKKEKTVESHTHTGGEKFKCKLCNKRFKTKAYLTQHMSSHSDIRQCQCNICKKCFKTNHHLKQHMVTHTGDKKYECDICKKRFLHKFNVQQHIYTHTGEKPFKCEMCDKRFTGKSDMKRHMSIHSDEKLFECSVCYNEYKYKSALKRHMLTEHKIL